MASPDIGAPPDFTLDPPRFNYQIRFIGESGTGSLAGLFLLKLTIDFKGP